MNRVYPKSLVMYSDGHFTWMNVAEGLDLITLPKHTSVCRVSAVREPMTPFEVIRFRKVVMNRHYQRWGGICTFKVHTFMQEGSNEQAVRKAGELVEKVFKEFIS